MTNENLTMDFERSNNITTDDESNSIPWHDELDSLRGPVSARQHMLGQDARTPDAAETRLKDNLSSEESEKSPKSGSEIKQPDGSTVGYDLGDDGKVHASRITYANANVSSYTRGADGAVCLCVTKDRNSKELSRISFDNGKVSLTVDGKKLIADVAGSLSVSDDGTWKLVTVGSAAQSWQTRTDGMLQRTFKTGNTELRASVLADGSSVLERRLSDGNFHPSSQNCHDGTRLLFAYDSAGKPQQIIESKPGLDPVFYDVSAADAAKWFKTVKHDTSIHTRTSGTLTLDKNFRPVFAEDNTRAVEVTDRGAPRTESDMQLERLFDLHDGLEALFPQIYAAKRQNHLKQVAQTWYRDQNPSDLGPSKPDPTRQQELVAKLQNLISAETENQKALEQEARKSLRLETALLEKERSKQSTARLSDRELWDAVPHTRRIYQEAVTWLENESVPSTLKALCTADKGRMHGEIPPNSPHPIPKHNGSDSLFLDEAYYRTLAANGNFDNAINLQINCTDSPTAYDLLKLSGACNWLREVEQMQHRQQLAYETSILLPNIVKENHLPEKWLSEFGKNPEGKRAALKEVLDIFFKLRNYTAAMASLKLDENGPAPTFFLTGSRLKIPPPPMSLIVKEDGATRYKFDFPESLVLEEPRNLAKIEAYKQWLDTYGPKIDEAIASWAEAIDHKKRLFYGEIEGDVYVTLDKNGKLDKILDPPEVFAAAGEREKQSNLIKGATRCNLLTSDFEVEQRNGRFFITSTLQAKDSHLYNYLNIGATSIGKPASERLGDTQRQAEGFAPEDLVAVRGGNGEIHVIAARDLNMWKSYHQFSYFGSKTAIATMDIGMTIGGVATGGTSALAWSAGKISTGMALRSMIPAAVRTAIGASGFFLNNAQAHSDPAWRTVNEVRGAVMVADVAIGSISGVAGIGRSAEALKASQEFGMAMEEGLRSSHWILKGMINPLHQAVESHPFHWTMAATNIFYGPAIANDIWEQVHAIDEIGKTNPFILAMSFIDGGRSVDRTPETADKIIAQQRVRNHLDLFDSQVSVISHANTIRPDSKAKVLEIARKTREFVAKMVDEKGSVRFPDGTPQEENGKGKSRKGQLLDIDNFRAELMTQFHGAPEAVASQIAGTNAGKDRREYLPDSKCSNVKAANFAADKHVQLVSAAALLVLSSVAPHDPAKPSSLASRTLHLPPHKMYTQHRAGDSTYRVAVGGPSTARQELRAADLVPLLKDNCVSLSPELQMISADMLVKLGERDQLSYVAVLQNTLNRKDVSDAVKTLSIAQLGQIINAMRLIESNMGTHHDLLKAGEHQKFLAYSYGLSSGDLRGLLQKTAANPDQSRNIRAMAAGVLFDLSSTINPKDLSQRISERTRSLARCLESEDNKNNESSFAEEVIAKFRGAQSGRDADTILTASLCLRDLGEIEPAQFNECMLGVARIGSRRAKFQEVAARAIAALDLTQMQYFSQDNRRELLELLKVPTDSSSASFKLAIAKRAAELAITPQQRSMVAELLAQHVSTGHKLYADRHPELREAATTAIGQLGVRTDSVVAGLRQALRPPAGNPRTSEDFEPDARVRLAALNALQKLGGSESQRLIAEAFEQESDSAVRSRLSEIRIQTHRPVPDWTWFHERDTLAARSIDASKYSIEAAPAWLRNLSGPLSCSQGSIHVPPATLTRSEGIYKMERRRESDGLGGIYIDVPVRVGTQNRVVKNPKYAEFWKAFEDQVFNVASQDSDEGHRARMALIYLVLRNGDPIAGDDKSPERRKCVDMAVKAISDMVHPGSGFGATMLLGVHDILCDPLVASDIRTKLVDELARYTKTPKSSSSISEGNHLAQLRANVGEYVIDAFVRDMCHSRQISPQNQQEFEDRQTLRLKLLDLIRELRSYKAINILEAVTMIEDKDWLAKNKRIQMRCRDVLADIRTETIRTGAPP